MDWIIKKLYFISKEMKYEFKNKTLSFVFEGGVFAKKIAFVFGKTDFVDYDFEITLSSLFSIHFKIWRKYNGFLQSTLNLALLGFSLFIAYENN